MSFEIISNPDHPGPASCSNQASPPQVPHSSPVPHPEEFLQLWNCLMCFPSELCSLQALPTPPFIPQTPPRALGRPSRDIGVPQLWLFALPVGMTHPSPGAAQDQHLEPGAAPSEGAAEAGCAHRCSGRSFLCSRVCQST